MRVKVVELDGVVSALDTEKLINKSLISLDGNYILSVDVKLQTKPWFAVITYTKGKGKK